MIPIMKPKMPDFDEVKNDIEDLFKSGRFIIGRNIEKFEKECADYLGVKYAVTGGSCTSGLMLMLSQLKKGSEVILPSFSFVATLQAVLWNNLKPIFVDINKYCLIDSKEVEAAITPNTGAILGVHMYGSICDVNKLENIAFDNNVKLFFDAAHAFGSTLNGKKAGSFGHGESFSLNITKAFSCVEGGLISTNDPETAKYARLGFNAGRETGSMNSSILGLSSRFQEFNAIVGLKNMEKIENNITKRNELANIYADRLSKINGIVICPIPDDVRSVMKDYATFIDEDKFGMKRDEIFNELEKNDIQPKKYFWPPMHELDFVKDKFNDVNLPMTKKLSETTISLPFYTDMPVEEIDIVCNILSDLQKNR